MATNKPATKPNEPPPAATPPAADTEKKRNPPVRQFAAIIAGLVAICNQKPIATILSNEDKAKVNAAELAVKEINSKSLKPIQDRIAAIEVEFKAILEAGIAKPGAAAKASELSKELNRLQKKLEAVIG